MKKRILCIFVLMIMLISTSALAAVGDEVYIYRHKSEARYYVTRHQSGPPKYRYNTDEMSVKRLKREQKRFFEAWLRGNIKFSDYYSKYYLTSLL